MGVFEIKEQRREEIPPSLTRGAVDVQVSQFVQVTTDSAPESLQSVSIDLFLKAPDKHRQQQLLNHIQGIPLFL